MHRHFTLEYWLDDGRYVGRPKEVQGVVSEGETLADLVANIQDAYQLVTDDPEDLIVAEIEVKQIAVEI